MENHWTIRSLIVLPGASLLSACGGVAEDVPTYDQTKNDCIAHFKAVKPGFGGNPIAFDAWEKDGKVIVEIGVESETGRGMNKTIVRNVVDHCIFDPETEKFRLPLPFDTSWSREED
ncbi:MAG: hypothetical protein AB7P20_26635 [Rhizobiaceae bacterium]